MTARRGRGNQLLGISAEKAENLLVSLANWERPRTPVDELSFSEYRKLRDAGKDLPPSAPSDDAWLRRLKAQTGKYWPDLWERTGEPPDITKEWALAILGRVRYYLRSFWKTQDPHARDWYIHRAREWYWLSRVHQLDTNVQGLRKKLDSADTADEARSTSTWLNITIVSALDQPPERTPFEESLFHLQNIARQTRFCPNPACQAPYFIATKKGQKFCSPECARPSLLQSKRNSYHKRRTKNES